LGHVKTIGRSSHSQASAFGITGASSSLPMILSNLQPRATACAVADVELMGEMDGLSWVKYMDDE
jgi:hypothetical protein